MNYQDINEEYENLNSRIISKKARIDTIIGEIERLNDEIIVRKGNIANLKLTGTFDPLHKDEEEIKGFENEIRKLKEELEQTKKSITPLMERVNGEIEKLKNDPDTKKHLDAVIQKRLKRALKKSEADKSKLVNEKFKTETLQQMINSHPSIANNIKGMISANNQIKHLENELAKINANGTTADLSRKVELENTLIPEAKAKFAKNKKLVQGVLEKEGTILTIKDIEDLVNGPIRKNKDGSINLDQTLNDKINHDRKELAKIDRRIAKDQISLDMIEAPYRDNNDNANKEHNGNELTGKESTIRWYNFIKRFKAWRAKRNTPELPEAKPVARGEVIIEEEKDSRFRDDLKYKIAQDYTRATLRNLDKQSRKIMRDAEKNSKDESDR